jgi:ATP-dependent helicase HrpB
VIPLPVDRVLPELVAALRGSGAVVVTAPPGTGKTTRVPPAILDALPDGEVWVLEPRRLAARAAARRVAGERGGEPGGEVGWRVRHERRVGPRTRLCFVTDGVLLRRLAGDPLLDGIAAVVLDEFHERHLEADLVLAMLAELRATVRPELQLVVMSATLAAGPLARFLGAATIAIDATMHPVAVESPVGPDARPLATRARDMVVRALAATAGDLLVFLPGVREIEALRGELEPLARRERLLLLPLHGQLEPEQQDLAVLPQAQRKVVLATNIAESSLTIEGVTAVVDSGLARVLRHDHGRGLDVLRTEPISLASAEQRRGRAGRTGPGVCYRLWTLVEQRAMPAFDEPEIRRVDLAGAVLAVRAFAARDPRAFGWFEAPDEAALARADALLGQLEAVGADGRLTATGRELLELPLHPRLGRLLVEARRRGIGGAGALLAALLSERDVLRPDDHAPEQQLDLLHRFELLVAAARDDFADATSRRLGLDPNAVRAVARAWRQIRSTNRLEPATTEALACCALAAFPDRVALRRGEREAVLAGGAIVQLGTGPAAGAFASDLWLAVDVQQSARGAQARTYVRAAVPLERDWLAAVHPALVTVRNEVEIDAARGRATAVRRTRYADLLLDERRGGDVDRHQARARLGELLARDPWRFLGGQKELRRLLARLAWLRAAAPELALPELDDAAIGALAADLAGDTSLEPLRDADLLPLLRARYREPLARLEREAPERITLPSGRSVPIDYGAEGGPAVAARLQEWFGVARVPQIANGRIALTVHLLAPNQRPVQITRDLGSFWQNVYPQVRSELMRRYPKHSWPEDPLRAPAERRPGRR